MDDVARMFQAGGPAMFLLMAAAMVAGPVACVAFVVALVPLRVPAAVWALLPAVAALVGLAGVLHGLSLLNEVLPQVPYDVEAALVAAGLSEAAIPGYLGLVVAGLLLLLSAGAAAVAHVARPGPEAALTPAHVAPGLAAAVVGGGLALLLGGPGASLGTVCSALTVALVGLRLGADGPHAERVAAGRVAVGALAALGLASLGAALVWRERAQVLGAMAHVDPADRATLAAVAEAATPAGWLAGAAVVALAGLVAGALAGPSLARPRTAAGAGAFALVLLAPTALAGWVGASIAEIAPLTTPWNVRHLAALDAAGLALPETTSSHWKLPMPAVRVHAGRLTVDGAPVASGDPQATFEAVSAALAASPPVAGEESARLEADASVTVAALAPVLRAAAAAGRPEVAIAGRGPDEGLGLATVLVDAPAPPRPRPVETREIWRTFGVITMDGESELRLRVAGRPGAWRVTTADGADRTVADPAGLRAALSAVKDAYPDTADLRLRPDADVTLGALLAVIDAAREQPAATRYDEPRELFPVVRLELP